MIGKNEKDDLFQNFTQVYKKHLQHLFFYFEFENININNKNKTKKSSTKISSFVFSINLYYKSMCIN